LKSCRGSDCFLLKSASGVNKLCCLQFRLGSIASWI
jgi:hypothetical protein